MVAAVNVRSSMVFVKFCCGAGLDMFSINYTVIVYCTSCDFVSTLKSDEFANDLWDTNLVSCMFKYLLF